MRNYTELSQLKSFKEKFDYLKVGGAVGDRTFGADRYLNQQFYHSSREWKQVRAKVIARDSHDGYPCDLGDPDHPIVGDRVVIHHMNPVTVADLKSRSAEVLNPEYLITTTDMTHKAIHYGSYDRLPQDYIPRRPNDTCPWK